MCNVSNFKENIIHCEEKGLVCSYDLSKGLSEMSRKLARGLCSDEESIMNILKYVKTKYSDIIDCDLIFGSLIAYKGRPIVLMKNANYKEQRHETIFYYDIYRYK